MNPTRRQVLKAGGALLLAPVVAACSGGGGSNATTARPKVSAPPGVTARGGSSVSFTYMRPVWGPATYTKGGPYEKELFRLANAEIDVQIVPVGDYDTKSNTVLASGRIPDVMWGQGPTSATWKSAQDQGAFHKVNKYLDQYPAIRNAVPAHTWELMKDGHGDIYFLPNTGWPIVPFFTFYRQDLFEKAGIDAAPKSPDAFVTTLERVHAAYPDVFPLSLAFGPTMWQAKDLATTFGVSLGAWMPDPANANRLLPWFELDKVRQFFFWMQDIHKRGLLDPNSGIQNDGNFMQDEFKAGKTAVLLENWAAYSAIAKDLQKAVPGAKLGVMPPIGALGGTRAVFPVDRGFAVAASYGDPDGFFAFLNWTLTGGNVFRRWGDPLMYTTSGGQRYAIPDEQLPPDYKRPQTEPFGFLSPLSEKLDWNQTRASFRADGIEADFASVQAMFNEYAKVRYPDWANPALLTPTDARIGTQILENTVQGVIDAVIINNQTTTGDWKSAVSKWEKAGGSQIIAERNRMQKNKSKPDYLA